MHTDNKCKSDFGISIRALSVALIIVFLSYDLSWAYPQESRRVSENTKLAPQSFFNKNDSFDRASAFHLEDLIENGAISRQDLTVGAIRAILDKHSSEDWFLNTASYTVSQHEIIISLSSGFALRYFDPTKLTALEQAKYSAQLAETGGMPASVRINNSLHKELLKLKALPDKKSGIGIAKNVDAARPPILLPQDDKIRPYIIPSEEFFQSSAHMVAERIIEYQRIMPGIINIMAGKGDTMIALLRSLSAEKGVDWKRVRFLPLVECEMVSPRSAFSFRSIVDEYFASRLPADNRLPPENIFDLSGNNIYEYRKKLKTGFRPHIALLGIGRNGHLGYNEPGSDFNSVARRVELDDVTLKYDMAHNPIVMLQHREGHRPYAYTAGLSDITSAESIFMLANTGQKVDVVKKAIFGPVTTDVPASILQTPGVSGKVMVLLNEDASSGMKTVSTGLTHNLDQDIKTVSAMLDEAGFKIGISEKIRSRLLNIIATNYLDLVVNENELRDVLRNFSSEEKKVTGISGIEQFERVFQNRILDYFLENASKVLTSVAEPKGDDLKSVHETYKIFYRLAHAYKLPYIRNRIDERKRLLTELILLNVIPESGPALGSRFRSKVVRNIVIDTIFFDKDPEVSEFAIATVIALCADSVKYGKFFRNRLYPLLKESENLPRFAVALMDLFVSVDRGEDAQLHIADKKAFLTMAAETIMDFVKDDLQREKYYFVSEILEYTYALIATDISTTTPSTLKLFREIEEAVAAKERESMDRNAPGPVSGIKGIQSSSADVPYKQIILSCEATEGQTVEEQTRSLLSSIDHALAASGCDSDSIVKQVVLLRDLGDKKRVQEIMGGHYGRSPPSATYIIQPPANKRHISIEITAIPKSVGAKIERFEESKLTIVTYEGIRWANVAALEPKEGLKFALEQAADIFDQMKAILGKYGFKFENVVRTWIYQGDITGNDGLNGQKYDGMNLARWNAFGLDGDKPVKFAEGFLKAPIGKLIPYPASTGISMADGTIVMECLAISTDRNDVAIRPLTNPEQTEVYEYPDSELYGKKVKPLFSRGTEVAIGDGKIIFVSGTASIIKEKSVGEDPTAQTENAIDNVARVLNEAGAKLEDLGQVRIYVKNEADYDKVREVAERRLGKIPHLYVIAGVCRANLLIELEGIAYSKRTILSAREADRAEAAKKGASSAQALLESIDTNAKAAVYALIEKTIQSSGGGEVDVGCVRDAAGIRVTIRSTDGDAVGWYEKGIEDEKRAIYLSGGFSKVEREWFSEKWKGILEIYFPDDPAIEVRQWKTDEEIEHVNKAAAASDLPGEAARTGLTMAKKMYEFDFDKPNQVLGKDFAPEKALIIGPYKNMEDIKAMVKAYPGLKEIHLAEVDEGSFYWLENELKKAGFPHTKVFGYRTSAVGLPDSLKDSIDLVFDKYVFAEGYFSPGQITASGREIEKVLKIGGVHITAGNTHQFPGYGPDNTNMKSLYSGTDFTIFVKGEDELISGKAASPAGQNKIEDPFSRVIIHDFKNRLIVMGLGDLIIMTGEKYKSGKATDEDIEKDLIPIREYVRVTENMLNEAIAYLDGEKAIYDSAAVFNKGIADLTMVIGRIRERIAAGGYEWDKEAKANVDELVENSDSLLLPSLEGVAGWLDRGMNATDIGAVIRDVVFFAKDRRLIPENIELDVRISKELERAGGIFTYKLILRMAIEEFLLNAVKYSGSNRIVISASLTESGEIRIDVTDYGVGISKENVHKIFASGPGGFSTARDKRTGTGYGLSALSATIESVGGKMGMDSEVGRGTVLSLTLPVNAPLDVVARPALSQPITVAVSGLRGSGRRITSQWLSAKLGLRYINVGFLGRTIIYEILKEGKAGKPIDFDDESAVVGYVKGLFGSGRLNYMTPALYIDDIDTSEPAGSEGIALRDRIKAEIDNSEENTATMHKVLSYPKVSGAIEEYLGLVSAQVKASGKYNGIVMRVSEPMLDRNIINVMLVADVKARSLRSNTDVNKLDRLDDMTGRKDLDREFPTVEKVDTTVLTRATAEHVLRSVAKQLPDRADRERILSELDIASATAPEAAADPEDKVSIERIIREKIGSGDLKMLFVCSGNVIRSACWHMAIEDLVKRAGLSDRINISSAGTAGIANQPWEPDVIIRYVKAVLLDHGVSPDIVNAFKSTLLDDSMRQVTESDIVFVAERAHRDLLIRKSPEAKGKVFLFSELYPADDKRFGTDISDDSSLVPEIKSEAERLLGGLLTYTSPEPENTGNGIAVSVPKSIADEYARFSAYYREVRESYGAMHPTYDVDFMRSEYDPNREGTYWPSPKYIIASFFEKLGVKPDDNMLEVGSGEAGLSFFLAHLFGIKATGVEAVGVRHDLAVYFRDRLIEKDYIKAGQVDLLNRNFTDESVDFSKYSLIYHFSRGTNKTKELLEKMLTVKEGAKILVFGYDEPDIESVLSARPDFEKQTLVNATEKGASLRVYTKKAAPVLDKTPFEIELEAMIKDGYAEGTGNFYAIIQRLGLHTRPAYNRYQNDIDILSRADELVTAVNEIFVNNREHIGQDKQIRLLTKEIRDEHGAPGIDVVVLDDGDGFRIDPEMAAEEGLSSTGKSWKGKGLKFSRRAVLSGDGALGMLEIETRGKRYTWDRKDRTPGARISDCDRSIGSKVHIVKVYPDINQADIDREAALQSLAAIHRMSTAIDRSDIKDGTRILLSESLFVKDGDESELTQVRLALASLLNSGHIAIMKPEEIIMIEKRERNKVSKDKLAIVLTADDWKGSPDEGNLKASLLIINDRLTGANYLYLEGVIGLARALMANNKQAVQSYYKLIFGVDIGADLLGLLDGESLNNIAFAVKAILSFKPIDMIDLKNLDDLRIRMESFLIAA